MRLKLIKPQLPGVLYPCADCACAGLRARLSFEFEKSNKSSQLDALYFLE